MYDRPNRCGLYRLPPLGNSQALMCFRRGGRVFVVFQLSPFRRASRRRTCRRLEYRCLCPTPRMFRARGTCVLLVQANWFKNQERRSREYDNFGSPLSYEDVSERMGLPEEYVKDMCTPKLRKGKRYPAMNGRVSKPNELTSQFERVFPDFERPKSVTGLTLLKKSDVSSQ